MSEDIVQNLIINHENQSFGFEDSKCVKRQEKKTMIKKGIKTCQTHPSFDIMEEGGGSLGVLFRI